MIEALLNLGYSGPLTLSVLLGLLFNYLIDTSIRNRAYIMQGLLMVTLVFAMRFDMVSLLKTITCGRGGRVAVPYRPTEDRQRPPSPAQST